MSSDNLPAFSELGLAAPLLQSLQEIGYETPSPIQAASIPHLLEGKDLLGQAQTGTGKTAAFALPLLSRIDTKKKVPQLLVLAPTRELAIQVAEAFQTYARHMPDFHVLPIYGGSAYDGQLRQLRRGVQVVVGTPGRVMDHIRRGSLVLNDLQALVLDEADEMLRMGFIDDVDWILEHTPSTRQIALFSATMPQAIRRLALQHLKSPEEIKIASKTATATTITQKYWRVSGLHKLDALTRILEMQQFDAMLIFVRTKSATVELSEKLTARGYSCEALNGDVTQQLRERTVERLRQGKLDIVVATDVVARGLDVERISHVLNYDIPYDTESYVHRIGRTGRAGREGEAILFVSPREQRMLRMIEQATRQKIEPMELPSTSDINTKRVDRFKQQISDTLDSQDLSQYVDLLTKYQTEHDTDPLFIAAALASLLQGKTPLLLSERELRGPKGFEDRPPRERGERKERRPKRSSGSDENMQRYCLSVGREHGVKPGNIVGAIANEADIESKFIGHIDIRDKATFVDLPSGLPKETIEVLKRTVVCGQRLNAKSVDGAGTESGSKPSRSKEGRDRPRKPRKPRAAE
ncbi:DEAD/DEAH box helicase [Neptunomonas phycophila]|uniref:DEAD/DEAH box helicase n=1 Tax=Neptunomonas phycophila TaxID=1572645 RepID=UPI0035159E59